MMGEMSIALENNPIGQVPNSGFMRGDKRPPCNLSILDPGDRVVVRMEESKYGSAEPCSSSSSIGKNSDDEEENEEDEFESTLSMPPFDSAVDSLEQALPIRRGISKFYSGKSKSFASLSDAACSSIKDIAKPENAFSRKRKNLLAYNLLYDKGQTSFIKSPGIGSSTRKRPIHSCRSTLALAAAMSNCESSIDANGSSPEMDRSNHSRTPSISPPASPHSHTPWRSFSLADLQHCAGSASCIDSNLPASLMVKRTKPDDVS